MLLNELLLVALLWPLIERNIYLDCWFCPLLPVAGDVDYFFAVDVLLTFPPFFVDDFIQLVRRFMFKSINQVTLKAIVNEF